MNLTPSAARFTVFPCTPADEILAHRPDGIMLSNGAGDPAENVGGCIEEIKKLLGVKPIFGICLSFTNFWRWPPAEKRKSCATGHRGGNQPVKDLKTGKVYITLKIMAMRSYPTKAWTAYYRSA